MLVRVAMCFCRGFILANLSAPHQLDSFIWFYSLMLTGYAPMPANFLAYPFFILAV